MMNDKTKQLILKMGLSRLIALMVLNLIVGSLLILNVNSEAKIAIAILLVSLNIGFIVYLQKQYRQICWALGLPSKIANVKLRGHTMITLDTPNEYQTALIQFLENESTEHRPNLKVEIGLSSVALPNMNDSFTAKIFMNDKLPILILNQDLAILAVVSGVVE